MYRHQELTGCPPPESRRKRFLISQRVNHGSVSAKPLSGFLAFQAAIRTKGTSALVGEAIDQNQKLPFIQRLTPDDPKRKFLVCESIGVIPTQSGSSYLTRWPFHRLARTANFQPCLAAFL
jgi:hypothetical protein